MNANPSNTPSALDHFQAWRSAAAADLDPDDSRGPELHAAEQAAMDAIASATATDLHELLYQVALLARLAGAPDDARFNQVADAIRATGAALGVGDVAYAIVGEVEALAEVVADLQAAAFEVWGNA